MLSLHCVFYIFTQTFKIYASGRLLCNGWAGQELVLLPRTTPQIKPLGSTLLLTCQVDNAGDGQTDYNLQWTALTDDGVPRTVSSRTGRFVQVLRYFHCYAAASLLRNRTSLMHMYVYYVGCSSQGVMHWRSRTPIPPPGVFTGWTLIRRPV